MKGKEFHYVVDCVEDEGFAYAFLHYSDFKEIEDKEFHRLRENFENAAHELAEYVGVDV